MGKKAVGSLSRAEEGRPQPDVSKAKNRKKKNGALLTLPNILSAAPVLICFIVIVALCSTFIPKEPKIVIELTDATFGDVVKKHPQGVLVDFFTPGCPHCEKLQPSFHDAARRLHEKGHGAVLARLDAKANPVSAKRLAIDRYPTVIWFRNGERVLELPPSSRSVEKIVEYVEWGSGPAMADFETESELEDALPDLRKVMPEGSAPMIVGFDGRQDSRSVIELIAERFRGKTVVMFVKQASASGALLRAIARDQDGDQEYREVFAQVALEKWVKEQVRTKPKPTEAPI